MSGFTCTVSPAISDGKNLVTTVTFSHPIIGTPIDPIGTTLNVTYNGLNIYTNFSNFRCQQHPNSYHPMDLKSDSNENLEDSDNSNDDLIDNSKDNSPAMDKKSYIMSLITKSSLKDTNTNEKSFVTDIIGKNIPDNFFEMIISMNKVLDTLVITDLKNMNFLNEKNKFVKYSTFNTFGLAHSILLSLHWKFKQIPPWIFANSSNMTGFFFDNSKYSLFFKDLSQETSGQYEENYWKKLSEVIPFLKKILNQLMGERLMNVSYDQFFSNQTEYQLFYYCTMVGKFFDKNDSKDLLIEKIMSGMEEINTLNKFLFKTVVIGYNECHSKINTNKLVKKNN